MVTEVDTSGTNSLPTIHSRKDAGYMTTTTIAIQGMTCSGCVNSVTKALNAVDGVQTVDVSLEQNSATVTFDDAKVDLGSLKEAIEDAGYDVA